MNIRFAIRADFSNATQEGKPNILGIFDIIHAPQLPFRLRDMQLVMRFEADISERKQEKEGSQPVIPLLIANLPLID